MQDPRPQLKDLDPAGLRALLAAAGEAPYRADQVLAWLYAAEMTDLSRTLRERLRDAHRTRALETVSLQRSVDGTRKAALRAGDGAVLESVLIPDEDRTTLCISTQVGCPLACSFCATGEMGFTRNLTTAEIVDQVCRMKEALDPGERITNVVFMGMGEPLDNLPAVAQAIRVLGDRHGLALAQRHITVSTVGRADILPRLAEEGLSRINLAVSLTVADDIKRSRLMPINRRHDVAELKRALVALPLPRGRRIMVSCALIAGLNDGAEDREALVAWCRDLPVLVNLIPFNPIPGSDWRRPDETSLHAFRDHLDRAGIPVRLRATRGDAVLAACGQLGRSRDRRDRAR